MNEWGRMQDLLHDCGVDNADEVIRALIDARDFFPGILGQTVARAGLLSQVRIAYRSWRGYPLVGPHSDGFLALLDSVEAGL